MYLFLCFLYYPVRELFSQSCHGAFWSVQAAKPLLLPSCGLWLPGAAAPSLLESWGGLHAQARVSGGGPQQQRAARQPRSRCLTRWSWRPSAAQALPARPGRGAGNSPLRFGCWVTWWSGELRAISLHLLCSFPAVEPFQHSRHSDRDPGQVLPPRNPGGTHPLPEEAVKCICGGKILLQGQKGKKRRALMGKESWGISHSEWSENTAASECYKPGDQIHVHKAQLQVPRSGARDRI